MELTEQQISDYNKDGYLILESFYDLGREIEPIQHSIYEVIGLIIKKHDLKILRRPFTASTFDDGYVDIIAIDRAIGGEVYDAVKQIPSFIRLLATDKHQSIFKQLFKNSIPGIAAAGYGIRIDNPYEDKFRAKWHQEYLSQLRSMEAFTLWSPLLDITKSLGPVDVCPGSHKEGVLKVSTGKGSGSNAYSLQIVNESDYLDKYKIASPLINVGDLMIIDWHTLHRSGENNSTRSRWSMQMRYFNFNNQQAIDIGWCGSFASGVDVSAIHPEYVVISE